MSDNSQTLAPQPPATPKITRPAPEADATTSAGNGSVPTGPPALVVVPLSSPTFSSLHSRSSSSQTSASGSSIPSPQRRVGIIASLDDLSDDLLSSILVTIAKSSVLPPLFRLCDPPSPHEPHGPIGLGIGSASASQSSRACANTNLQQGHRHRARQLVPVQVQTLIRLSRVSRRFHSLVHDEFIWLQVYSALNAHRIVTAGSQDASASAPSALGATRPPLVLASAPTLATSSAPLATHANHDPALRSTRMAATSLQTTAPGGQASRGLQLSDFQGSWLALVRDLIRIDKTWRLKQFDIVHVELAPLPAVLGHFSLSDHTVGALIDDGKLDTAYLSMATDDEPLSLSPHSPTQPHTRSYRRGLAVLARHLIRAQPSSSESDASEGEDEFESFPPTYSRSTYGSTPRSSPIRPTKLRTVHVLEYPSLRVLANHAIYRDPNLGTYPFLPAMQVHYQQFPAPGASKFYDLTEPNSAGARGGGNALFRLLGLDLPRTRYALCYSARSDTSRCVLAIVDYASDRENVHCAQKYLHSYLGIPFTETFYTLQSGDYMLAYLSPVDETSTNLCVTIDFLAVDPTTQDNPSSSTSSPSNLQLIARHIVPQPADFFYPFPDGRHVPLSKLVVASANGIFSTWSFPPMHDLTKQMSPLECFSTRPSATAVGKTSLDLDVLYDKPWYRPTILNEIPSIRPLQTAGSHGSAGSAIDFVENAPQADAYARREWHQILVGVRDTNDPSAANADHLLSPFNRIYELYTLPVRPAPVVMTRFSSPAASSTSSLASSTSSGMRTSPASSYLQPPLSATSSSPHSSSSGSGSSGSIGSLNSNATLTRMAPNSYTSPSFLATAAGLPRLPPATPLSATPLFSARIDEPVIWQNMCYHLYLAAHADTWARLVCLDLANRSGASKPMPMLDLSRPTASRAFTHAHGQHCACRTRSACLRASSSGTSGYRAR
ncbi:hypothetical protein BCR44DRAFT_1294645 [Catenaria anguillulae PL171]|uniref:F-box domain-containing protein n=1 Tax=Catenaria anguillulae PL171 TaxID=765915 RepID=A0A1Y2HV80_9FUNG|nr:hypothetical protein BCR44DRAFT_1294645 [Catenaria anguillulae PL171]